MGFRTFKPGALADVAKLRPEWHDHPFWVVFENLVPFRVLYTRVPYYIGDLKRDLNLENYPYASQALDPGLKIVCTG